MESTCYPMGMRQETLSRIEDAHRYSSFYEKDLSNHLPMALTALDGLGASGAQVAAFAARYEGKLEPLPAAEASRMAFFRQELERDGERAVLERWLERLIPGVCSIAVHGLVRIAYAVESGSRSELAQALAHWELGYQTLGALPEAVGSLTPAQADLRAGIKVSAVTHWPSTCSLWEGFVVPMPTLPPK